MNEANLQAEIRLDAARQGCLLMRNNCGALMDKTGRMVRFGLGNDSAALHKKVKSADLVGITRYTVRPEDVGITLGVFTSVEVKSPGWRMSHSEHEVAQMKWAELVRQWGGRAGFAWDIESARGIYRE